MAAGKSDAFRSEVRAVNVMWFWWFMLQNSPFNEKYGYMEKRIHMLALVLIVGICTGCGKENTGIENFPVKEQTASTSSENDELESNEELRIDFTYDYSMDIKADVDDVVSDSTSLQEELTNIEKITQKYTPLAEAAQTQSEMNVAAPSEFFPGGNYKKQGLYSGKRVSEDKRGSICYAGNFRKVWNICRQSGNRCCIQFFDYQAELGRRR